MPNWNKHEKRKRVNGGEDEKDKGGNEDLVCCYPDGCTKKSRMLNRDDLSNTQRVTCSNSKCEQSGYMHMDCFLKFEAMVVAFLGRQGRARSWNDSQRLNNVWNKKGYELAFKMCGCLCGHGNLRKDVDWSPPKPTVADELEGAAAVECEKKKKKKEKVPSKPKLNQHGDWISQGKLKLLGLSTHKPELQDGDEASTVVDAVPSKPVIPRLAKKQTATHQFLRSTSMINIQTEPPSLVRSWSKLESVPKVIPGLCTTAETKSIPGLVSEENPITAKRKKHVSGTSDTGSQPSNSLSQTDSRDWEEEDEEEEEEEEEEECEEGEEEDEEEGWMKVGKGGSKGTSRRNSVCISESDWPHGQARAKKRSSLQWRKEDGLIGLDIFADRDCQSENQDDFSSLRSAGTSNFISSVDIENLPTLEMRNVDNSLGRRVSPGMGSLCRTVPDKIGKAPCSRLGDSLMVGGLGDTPVVARRIGILGDRKTVEDDLMSEVDYRRPPPGIGVVSRPRVSPLNVSLSMGDLEAPRKVGMEDLGATGEANVVSQDDVWESDDDALTENSSEKTLSSYRTAQSASQSPSCDTQPSFEFPMTRDFSPDRGPGGSWFSDTNQLSAFGRELLGGNRGDGKRDENGFIHCSSCEVVCRSLPDFSRHVRSPRHLAAADLNKQLQGGGIDLGGGWEKAVLREAARKEEDLKRMLEESRQAQEKLVKIRDEMRTEDVEDRKKATGDTSGFEKMKQKDPEKEVKIRETELDAWKDKMTKQSEEVKKAKERQRMKDELNESKKILEESRKTFEESHRLKVERIKLDESKKELKVEQDRYEENKKELKKLIQLAAIEAKQNEKASDEACKELKEQLNQRMQEMENVDVEVEKRKEELGRLEEKGAEKRRAMEVEAENVAKWREETREKLEKDRKEEEKREENKRNNSEILEDKQKEETGALKQMKSVTEVDPSYLEKMESRLALAEDLNTKLANEVEDLKYNNGMFVKQVTILQESNADLTKKVSDIQPGLVSLSDLQISNTSLVSLVGELQIKNQELSEKLQFNNEKTDEMMARMEKMEKALEGQNDLKLLSTFGEVEKPNSLTKVRDDQEVLKSSFVTLLQSCESFQYELDRLDEKNKRLENDLKACMADLAKAESDKEKLNIEVVSVKATLNSASKAWDMQSLVRIREMEALQYNMAVLYNQNQDRRRNEFGAGAVRDVANRLSGDVDSGIVADRVSRSSSSGVTDISNEDTDKVEKDEETNGEKIIGLKNSLEVRGTSCSTPSPSYSSGGVAEGAAEDSLGPVSEDSLGIEDRSSVTSSPPTVQARDTVASWIDRNNSRQFFKYSTSTTYAKTPLSPLTPASLSGSSPMPTTLSVSPPMPSNYTGVTHNAPPPYPGSMNMWMSSDGSFLAIPPSNMATPMNPIAMSSAMIAVPHTSGASRMGIPHSSAGSTTQVSPNPYPQVMPFPYQRLYTIPGHNLYYHQ